MGTACTVVHSCAVMQRFKWEGRVRKKHRTNEP